MRQETRPTHLLAVGVLVWDDAGRVLLVRPVGRRDLALPGGTLGHRESPARAGVLRVAEATGLRVQLGRLLAVEHRAAYGDVPATVRLAFDSSPLASPVRQLLVDTKVVEAQWLTPFDAVRRHGARDRTWVTAAFAARRLGTTRYVDSDTVRHDRPRATPGVSV